MKMCLTQAKTVAIHLSAPLCALMTLRASLELQRHHSVKIGTGMKKKNVEKRGALPSHSGTTKQLGDKAGVVPQQIPRASAASEIKPTPLFASS